MVPNMNKVVFIGAGPGDPELITLKGKKWLEKADSVIYAGSLLNPEYLKYCKKGVELHDSAKMSLPEVQKKQRTSRLWMPRTALRSPDRNSAFPRCRR